MAWCLCCCSWTTDIWREPQIHADLPTTNSFRPTPVGTHRNLWWISPSNLAVQFIEWHIMQGAANQWWTSWSPACGNFINVYHPSFSHGRKYLLCSELYLETSISVEELSKKIFLLAACERCSSSCPNSPHSELLCFQGTPLDMIHHWFLPLSVTQAIHVLFILPHYLFSKGSQGLRMKNREGMQLTRWKWKR